MTQAIKDHVDTAKHSIEKTIIDNNKSSTEELQLEIVMNRTGYSSLLETNKLALQELFNEFKMNTENQVRRMIEEYHQRLLKDVNDMVMKHQIELQEQIQKVVYHQTKNALTSHQKTQGKTRFSSTPPDNRVSVPTVGPQPPANTPAPKQIPKTGKTELQKR